MPGGMAPMGLMPPGAPMGPPAGGDPSAMQALDGLSGVPSGAREKQALGEAKSKLRIAAMGLLTRSAQAAQHVMKAVQEIEKAEKEISQLAESSVGPPPNLLGSMLPMSQGNPAPML